MTDTTKKTLVIINHKATEDQIDDLIKCDFATSKDDIIVLPEELHQQFKNVDPEMLKKDLTFVEGVLNIIKFIKDNDITTVWAQGEFTFCFELASIVNEMDGVNFIIATTKRDSKDIPQSNGTIKKINIFKHVGFREVVAPTKPF